MQRGTHGKRERDNILSKRVNLTFLVYLFTLITRHSFIFVPSFSIHCDTIVKDNAGPTTCTCGRERTIECTPVALSIYHSLESSSFFPLFRSHCVAFFHRLISEDDRRCLALTYPEQRDTVKGEVAVKKYQATTCASFIVNRAMCAGEPKK